MHPCKWKLKKCLMSSCQSINTCTTSNTYFLHNIVNKKLIILLCTQVHYLSVLCSFDRKLNAKITSHLDASQIFCTKITCLEDSAHVILLFQTEVNIDMSCVPGNVKSGSNV